MNRQTYASGKRHRGSGLAGRGSCVRAGERAGDAEYRGNVLLHLKLSAHRFCPLGDDLLLRERLALRPDIARTLIGFMGCAAAIPALRMAQDTIRSNPAARVLVINVELSSLHMQESDDIETVLSFLIFGDGASAALVT